MWGGSLIGDTLVTPSDFPSWLGPVSCPILAPHASGTFSVAVSFLCPTHLEPRGTRIDFVHLCWTLEGCWVHTREEKR